MLSLKQNTPGQMRRNETKLSTMSKIQWRMRWLRSGLGADILQSDNAEDPGPNRTQGHTSNPN